MADSLHSKCAQSKANKSASWLHGPRSLCLKRSEYGFGFTLRHFIVYPPESFSVWKALGSPRVVDPAQPMDTIFVKQVHAKSPASEAGLSTGDRIVGVNGKNVAGRSYAHVVQLIQHTDLYLRLAVVPQEHDILQIHFKAAAHNPETNQRPRLHSPDKQASGLPVPIQRMHRHLDNTPHLTKAIKQQQSLDNALKARSGTTPRYRHPTRRASEGDPLKREAIYGSDCLVWDEKRGITRENARENTQHFKPLRKDMVVGCPRTQAHKAGTPTDSDMSDSSNSLYYQSPSSVDTSRRESLTNSKDSLSSLDSTSTLTGQDQSSDDSLIMSRIRKSFEQKEEFLRRPNQPILYNLSPENVVAVPSIREFYARPQKLQKSMWPPNNTGPGVARATDNKPANRNLRRVRSELDSDRDFVRSNDRTSPDPMDNQSRGNFVYGGQVTNVPNSNLNQLAQDVFRPTGITNTTGHNVTTLRQSPRSFITTLSRIHENLPDSSPSPSYSDYDETSSLPSSPPSDPFSRSLSSPTNDNRYGPHTEQVQMVSRRARQFETGQLEEEDRTDFYRSELARLSAKKSVPTVALRTREFESRGGQSEQLRQQETHSLEATGLECLYCMGSSYTRPSLVDVAAGAVGPHATGNRVILIGTKNIHCVPPHGAWLDFQDGRSPNEGSCLRARSNSAESWAAAFGGPRNGSGSRGPLEWPLDRKGGDEPVRHKAVRQDSYLAACRTPVTPEPRLLKRQGSALDDGAPPPSRPTQLDIPDPLSLKVPQEEAGVVTHPDVESLISALDDAAAQGLVSINESEVPIVIRRQKNSSQNTNDDDRLRRASYLKATCGERMHMDSDHEYSDTEQQLRSANRKWRPPLFPDDIQQLREFFEEGSQSVATRPSLRDHPVDISTPVQEDKENVPATREGWLHCKITVIDGKRAGDRSWKQVWAILADHTLTLLKDRRDSQAPAIGNESESVDMMCAQVDKAGDYTKRKHVLRINTLSCSELLLQTADGEDMTSWLTALNQASREDCSSLKSPPGSARLSPMANKGMRKLTTFRTRSPTGQSPVNKNLKPSSAEPVAGSPKTKTWKGRMARQFKRIQHGANSPSSPTVDSYPEGSTIGIPLEHCPMSQENELVPFLVVKCTAIVEERGLDIIGIYRVPGNTAAISSLTEAVNKGFQFNNFQDQRWCDVNVISSLLKLFFRKLPDALLTSDLYPLFIDADKIEDANTRITSLKKLIHELPDYHFETLKFLLTHLRKVVNHSSVNKMEARNLAIVFGPTLVRTADNNMVTMVTDMSHQCRIVESLLLYSDWFFSEDEEPSNFPPSFPNDSAVAELEATAINHNQNLLLSNIQKVEGMKSDSAGKDSLAKVIGSSIISAANRKIQKTKTRRSNAEESREEEDRKQKELPSGEDPASVVASSIVESVMMTGNIVKNLQVEGGDDTQETSGQGFTRSSVESESGQQKPSQRKGFQFPIDFEDGTIRTYAGLSATTQERIRRFEQETKAMLQRDLSRQRDAHHQLQEQQSNRDGDEMAELTADLMKKMPDVSSANDHHATSLSSDSKSHLTSSRNSDHRPPRRSPPSKLSAVEDGEPEQVKTVVSRLTRKSFVGESHNTETTVTHTIQTGTRTSVKSDNVKVKTLHIHTNPLADSCAQSNTGRESSTKRDKIHVNPIAESPAHRVGSGTQDGGTRSTEASLPPPTTTERETSRMTKKHVCDSWSSKEQTVRRGSSAENVAELGQATQKTANGTLKRFKTGKEQPTQLMSSLRCGSLDSLQEVFSGSDRPASDGSDDGSDLLSSLTSTFDRKLKSLLSGSPPVVTENACTKELSDGTLDETTVGASPPRSKIPTFRDPSLHRRASRPPATSQDSVSVQDDTHPSVDKQAIRRQWLEMGGDSASKLTANKECVPPSETTTEKTEAKPRSADKVPSKNELRLSANTNKLDWSEKKEATKLKRSESLKKYEKDDTGTNVKLRRAASLTKADSVSSTKLKRSESLTKTEKTESNICKRRQSELLSKRSIKEKENIATTLTKLKRKNGMPERAIKRRHTVGGTKDFDKINWLDNRLQEECLESSENTTHAPHKLRTSSPDLSSSRTNAFRGQEGPRPQSLVDANVPLESHV